VKRYLLDDYTVSYAPNGYALQISQRRAQQLNRQQRTLLAVVNPTCDLTFTPMEGEAVATTFATAARQVLAEEKATLDAVIVQSQRHSYLHFSCHGFYDWQDPMGSGLKLAGGKILTVSDIIARLDLRAARLLTLSACETGLTDIRRSPDEYIGLPAGFMQGGTPAVISTLWAVNDLSTMLLIERFYQCHIQEGLDIPSALRRAQRWLRDVAAETLAGRFASEQEVKHASTPVEKASQYFSRFARQFPQHRPFAHPYYWGAFTFSGA
jgi:CHAT domain-containing protein